MIIMVPIDGSHFSEQALPMALQIAGRTHATIHLLRVHGMSSTTALAGASGDFNEELDRETRDAELRYVIAVAERWSSATGVSVFAYAVEGLVIDALAAHVAQHGVDLVVMTTHGRGGLSRAWLGSVADRLVRTLDIPVLLRRPLGHATSAFASTPAARRVLIPLDGSVLAEMIVDEAVRVAPTGAAFTLMRVIAPPIIASPEATLQFEMEVDAARCEAIEYLDLQAVGLRARGFTVETRVVMQSNIAAAIVEEAVESGCDIIAMATHGRSGLVRIALGSVADKVLRSSSIPLLVIKPDALRAAEHSTHELRVAL